MAAMADFAKEMIEANGRPCNFTMDSRASADSSKPWRAPSPVGGKSFTGVQALVTSTGWETVKTQDATNDVGARREVSKQGSSVLLVAHSSFPEGTTFQDVRKLDRVSDGFQTWRIQRVEVLIPGTTAIIYTMSIEA